MNHASVFFFSIGNEIPQGLSAQGVREAAEISVREKTPFCTSVSIDQFPKTGSGQTMCWRIEAFPQAFIREIDPQRRPLTMGFNKGSGPAELAVLGDLDVPGNNYDCTGCEASACAVAATAVLQTLHTQQSVAVYCI
jgi:hypothetical protein